MTRPARSETQLAFAGLSSLLNGIELDRVDGLSDPQRLALEVALLRADPTGPAVEPRAIATGLLSVLRSLVVAGLLLIAVDDVQWLDGASADALAFAARRLDHEPVEFLLARRPGQVHAIEQAVGQFETERVDVGPLSPEQRGGFCTSGSAFPAPTPAETRL